MTRLTPVLSMLHESAGVQSSAVRLFRERAVLGWTLERLRRATLVDSAMILCWDDQSADVRPIAHKYAAQVVTKGERVRVPSMDAITAARRWSDGWRGGLLQTCEFDRGFHAPWLAELAESLS